MQISHIELQNWKNFRHCSVDVASRCFIVGANASGKSNFLDALRFLHDVAKQGGGLQTAVSSRGGLTKIRCLSARRVTDISIKVTLRNDEEGRDRWRYALTIKGQGGGVVDSSAVIVCESVYDCDNEVYVLNRNGKDKLEDKETLKVTHLEQAVTNTKFREILECFREMEYLNIVPQLVREPGLSKSITEDYYGRDLLVRLAKLNENTRASYLRQINDVMVRVVPKLKELSFSKDANGTPHLEAKFEHWRAQGARQNESVFSDGTLRLIGFLFALTDGSGIVLLEEPENNLHTAVVEQLPEFIARIRRHKNRQVFATTHSFEILNNQGLMMKEVLLLETDEEETKVTNVSNDKSVVEVVNSGMTIADAILGRNIINLL